MPAATTTACVMIFNFCLKLSVVIAGFLGGLITLTFVRQLTSTQMTVAVLTGAITTHYLTPVAMHYSGATGDIEDGIAFLIGVMSMNIIPGFLRLSELFKADPGRFIPGVRTKDDNADGN